MSTISKLTSPSPDLAANTSQKSEKGKRTDSEVQQVSSQQQNEQAQGSGPSVNTEQTSHIPGSSVSEKQVQEMSDELQKTLDKATKEQFDVGFRQDSRTESYVIEIKNKDGELVKQFPPEKVLNLQGKMDELSGMVVDEMT